jgi:hypothetical protein
MADARSAGQAPRSLPGLELDGGQCQVISCCKKRRRVPRPPPPPPWRSVHVDLVGHCFNWLRPDHVTAACSFVAHCLRCHREGHQARAYKRPQSPDAVGPLPRRPLIVVLNPLSADVALAEPKAAGQLSSDGGATVFLQWCCSVFTLSIGVPWFKLGFKFKLGSSGLEH